VLKKSGRREIRPMPTPGGEERASRLRKNALSSGLSVRREMKILHFGQTILREVLLRAFFNTIDPLLTLSWSGTKCQPAE
jgi:hypothetical protein